MTRPEAVAAARSISGRHESRFCGGNRITGVLMCAEAAARVTETSRVALASVLNLMGISVRFLVVGDLCRRPDAVGEAIAAAGIDRVVLVTCAGQSSVAPWQRSLRTRGIDPLGVQVVRMPAVSGSGSGHRATASLAGSIARAALFPGASAANHRLRLDRLRRPRRRRDLFRLPPPSYTSIPAAAEESCGARAGCDVCALACPAQAIEIAAGAVRITPGRCRRCGQCVAACPTGSMRDPTCTPAQIDAQLAAVLAMLNDADPTPRSVVFVCEDAAPRVRPDAADLASAGWLPVRVPCIGIVRSAWLFRAIDLGADAVAIAPQCAACGPDDRGLIERRIEFGRRVLADLGQDPARILILDPNRPPAPQRSPARLPSRDPLATRPVLGSTEAEASMMVRLADRSGRQDDLEIPHPAATGAHVTISPDRCTGCEACANVCPTGALVFERRASTVQITFDRELCRACRLCERSCPEIRRGAIRVVPALLISRGPQVRQILSTDSEIVCERCGRPIAPHNLLQRVADRLATRDDRFAPTITHMRTRCPTCRGLQAPVTGTRERL